MFKVFVADKLAPEGIDALKQYPELEVTFEPGLSPEEAKKFAEDADAIIVRSATKMKGMLLNLQKGLKSLEERELVLIILIWMLLQKEGLWF